MILELKNIRKSFGKKTILQDVSFSLNRGTLTGIVGENGAGKSTLLKIIVGEISLDKGIRIIKGKIGYCPQDALTFPRLSVKEHFTYFSAAYDLPRSSEKEQSTKLLRHFNYERFLNEKVINLSGGTRQKLNLSIALLHKPDILILDEPYNGFDWETYQKFWEYTNILKNKGCAILIVTHLINEKKDFDHIFHLKNGKLK